jgi:hypothetical protein
MIRLIYFRNISFTCSFTLSPVPTNITIDEKMKKKLSIVFQYYVHRRPFHFSKNMTAFRSFFSSSLFMVFLSSIISINCKSFNLQRNVQRLFHLFSSYTTTMVERQENNGNDDDEETQNGFRLRCEERVGKKGTRARSSRLFTPLISLLLQWHRCIILNKRSKKENSSLSRV